MANKNGAEKLEKAELHPWRKCEVKISTEDYKDEEPLFHDIKTQKKELSMWEVYSGQVTEVQKNDFFKYYNNRAYIVLSDKEVDNPKEQTSRFCHLHIWVSKFCSGEDYQLAVLRAEQLEKMVDIKAFVHREIELHETDVFHNHVPVDSGVIEVRRSERSEGESPHHHLLQFRVEETAHGVNANTSSEGTSKRLKRKWMIERKCIRGNLTSDDVFVLKNYGDSRIFQWNGQRSNLDEQTMAKNFIKKEQDESRPKHQLSTVTEGDGDKNHYFYSLIMKIQNQMRSTSFEGAPAKVPLKAKSSSEGLTRKGSIHNSKGKSKPKFKTLYQLSDDNVDFIKREDTTISKNKLESNYVYLLDTDYIAYVWIGEDWVCQDGQGRLILILEAVDKLLVDNYEDVNEGSDRFHQPVNKPITLIDENDHYVPLNKLLRD